jgi:hypothetical protein
MQAQPPVSILPLLCLWAIGGAIYDWRYKRRGGVRSTKHARISFWVSLSAAAGFLILLALRGTDAGIMGGLTADFSMGLVVVWQTWRWIVRRRHPLPPQGQGVQ